MTKEMAKSTTKMKKRNLAILEVADATPLKPNNAAITAIIKNIIAQ
jgi:hypothetical protein